MPDKGSHNIKHHENESEILEQMLKEHSGNLEQMNYISHFFYCFLSKIVKKIYKKSVTVKDMWLPNKEHQHDLNGPIFIKYYYDWQEKNAKAGKPRDKLWKIMFVYHFRWWKWALMLMACGQMVQACLPFLLKGFINWVKTETSDEDYHARTGWLLSTGIGLCVFTRVICDRRGRYNNFYASLIILSSLRALTFDKMTRVKPAVRPYMGPGASTNLIINDVEQLARGSIFWHQVFIFPFLMIAFTTMLIIDVGAIGLIIPVIIFLTIVLQFIMNNHVYKWTDLLKKDIDLRSTRVSESIKGIKIIKFNAWEKIVQKLIFQIRKLECYKIKRILRFMGWSDLGIELLPMNMALLIFGVYNNYMGQLTLAQTYSMITIFNLMFLPTRKLNFSLNSIITGFVALERFERILKIEDKEELEDTPSIGVGEIKTVHLNASYNDQYVDSIFRTKKKDGTLSKSNKEEKTKVLDEKEQNENECSIVLNDINIDLKPGSFTSIIGPVGAGKSSLLLALLGEMVYTKLQSSTGESANTSNKQRITINPNKVISKNGRIVIITQTANLLNATIKDNILFGAPYDEKRYRDTLKRCQLLKDLMTFKGFDLEEIGERGVNLSGGQKQRISIARAYYQNADIYLIDDSLSALDGYVGREVFQKVFKDGLRGKTRVMVTHQLQYLGDIDDKDGEKINGKPLNDSQIILMRDGKIACQGPFKEMEKNTLYKEFAVSNADHEDAELKLYEKAPHKEEDLENQRKMSNDIDVDKLFEERYSKKEKQGNLENEGKLVIRDKKKSGDVTSATYSFYYNNFGKCKLVFNWMLYLFFTIIKLAGDYWLGVWSSENNDMELSDAEYTYVYIGLWVALFLILISRILFYSKTASNNSLKLNNRLISSLMHRPQSFYDTTPTGEILNRTTKEIFMLDVNFASFYHQYIYYSTFLFIAMAITIYSFPYIIVIIVLLSFYLYRSLWVMINCQVELKRLRFNQIGKVINIINEYLNNNMLISSLKREKQFIRKFEVYYALSVRVQTAFFYISLYGTIRFQLITGFFVVLMAYIFTSLKVFDYTQFLDAENIGIVLTWCISIAELISFYTWASTEMPQNMVSYEKLKEYIENKNVVKEWDSPSIPSVMKESDQFKVEEKWPTCGDLQFKDLKVRYRENLPLVLNGLTFDVKHCQKVGIVGRTGSGKSTIILALTRILEKANGAIIWDRIDISKLGLHELRKNIVVIPQDPVLLAGTLEFNVDPWNEYGKDKVVSSLLKTGFFETMIQDSSEESQPENEQLLSNPQGSEGKYDKQLQFEIQDGGSNLSVGQRQLICIARAMIQKPLLLLMDEATANIDTKTDGMIQKLIHTEFEHSTVLTIAHRLDTIIDYDKLVVLDQGKVIEEGVPGNLLMQPAKESQFRQIVEENGQSYRMDLLSKAKFTGSSRQAYEQELGLLKKESLLSTPGVTPPEQQNKRQLTEITEHFEQEEDSISLLNRTMEELGNNEGTVIIKEYRDIDVKFRKFK